MTQLLPMLPRLVHNGYPALPTQWQPAGNKSTTDLTDRDDETHCIHIASEFILDHQCVLFPALLEIITMGFTGRAAHQSYDLNIGMKDLP